MATMTIEDYKKQYEAARAAGDAAGMQAANDGANAIRASQGVALEYANQDIANVAASSKASSSSSDTANKYYTGSQPTYSTVGESAYNASKSAGFDADTDYSTLLKQQIAAGASANDVYNTLASRIAKANSNDSLKQYAWDDNTRQAIEYLVTQQGGSLAGIDADFAAKATKDMLSAGGTAGAPSGQSLTGYVNDYSSYLEQMYAAQKAAALAGIKNAYEQNINAIDRAGDGVDEAYQTARNNAAGASELAKRNFAEYAAANGLNSGAGGQAELARNVTMQNNLNTIDTQEAQTIADLELQRANAETEYNNAIAQAEATGNYELAAALYQEKVRYDNSMISAIQQEYQNAMSQYQLNYQAQRDAVSDSQWQQSFGLQQQQYNDSVVQSQKSTLAEYGNAFLQQGLMPSTEMLNAMGITAQDAQNYIAAVQAQKVAAASSGSNSSGSTMTLTTAKQYASNGIFNDDVLATFYKNGWNDELLAIEYGYTGGVSSLENSSVNTSAATNSGTGMNDAYFAAMAKSIASAMEQGKASTVVSGLDGVWSNLSQTQKQTIQKLLGRYGYQYQEG